MVVTRPARVERHVMRCVRCSTIFTCVRVGPVGTVWPCTLSLDYPNTPTLRLRPNCKHKSLSLGTLPPPDLVLHNAEYVQMVLSHSCYKTFIPRESADWPPARYTVWPSRRTAARFEWLSAHRPSRCVFLAYQSGRAAATTFRNVYLALVHRRGLAHRRMALVWAWQVCTPHSARAPPPLAPA